jgi:hypothetical protein
MAKTSGEHEANEVGGAQHGVQVEEFEIEEVARMSKNTLSITFLKFSLPRNCGWVETGPGFGLDLDTANWQDSREFPIPRCPQKADLHKRVQLGNQ